VFEEFLSLLLSNSKRLGHKLPANEKFAGEATS